MTSHSLHDLEREIKRTIIAQYVQRYIGELPPDQLVADLNRIFRRKQKVFVNLARWAQKQVERGHAPAQVVGLLGFYAQVLAEFQNKNLNQPPTR